MRKSASTTSSTRMMTTLPDRPEAQDVFDFVAAHLLRQGVKAKHSSGRCAYRDAADRSCAIGCLIPNHLYRANLEFVPFPSIRDAGLSLNPMVHPRTSRWYEILSEIGIRNSDLPLLRKLRMVHDTLSVRDWPAGLRTVATAYNLSVPASVPSGTLHDLEFVSHM